MNHNILKEHILNEMDAVGITQYELAEELGTSQARVSRCLNHADGAEFSLEQVCAMADIFGTSLDALTGREQTFDGTSLQGIAGFLEFLLSGFRARLTTVTVSETAVRGGEERTVTQQVPAIYFPQEICPEDFAHTDPARAKQLAEHCRAYGSAAAENVALNEFLAALQSLLSGYRNGTIKQKVYDSAVEQALAELEE